MLNSKTTLAASKQIRSKSRSTLAVDRACEVISSGIASGFYDAGEHLSESRLVADLNVSRGTVRQALARLAGEGVLQILPNRGAIVQRLSRQDLADFFQLRVLYESFGARRAAARINEIGNRERVTQLVTEIDDHLKGCTAEEFAAHDGRFHTCLLEMSGNRLLLTEWNRTRLSRFRQRYLYLLDETSIRRSLQQHRDIAIAILREDDVSAERLSAAHIQTTNHHIQEMSDSRFHSVFNLVGS